jgi:hypothetical protein
MIRWVRKDGLLQLEVTSISHLLKEAGAGWTGSLIRDARNPWPPCGSCALSVYHNRKLNVTEPKTETFNPSDI